MSDEKNVRASDEVFYTTLENFGLSRDKLGGFEDRFDFGEGVSEFKFFARIGGGEDGQVFQLVEFAEGVPGFRGDATVLQVDQ